jgi:2-polyprenyl-3-methyl-5-hydroxy-6-metoxy-1,4-benzoquinol methylase
VLNTDVTRCRRCGLLYVNPPPTPDQIAQLYDASYWDAPGTGAREASRRYHRHYRFGAAYGRRLQQIARQGRMLEIGCGPGFFLKGVADHCDWQVEGVDVAADLETFAREKLGVRVTAGRFEEVDFGGRQFDLVLGRDVIEHVPRPMAFLEAAHRLLRPGGLLELELPNGPLDLAPARRASKRGERASMGAGHLLFISPRVLCAMVMKAGFLVVSASVHSFRDGLRARGLWPERPCRVALGAPKPPASQGALEMWQRPAPERGLRGTMWYSRLRRWRSTRPALPAWLPLGFRQHLVARRTEQ